jgi:5-methylcytosine-specific restriction protein A
MNPEDLYLGQVLNNNELIIAFRCGARGGMRRSHETNTLVIVSDHFKLYDDRWEDSILHYTGMGSTGDQSLMFMQNRTLVESNNNRLRYISLRYLILEHIPL